MIDCFFLLWHLVQRIAKSFQDSLAIWERLVKTDPNNRLWQSNLAAIYQRIGDALKAQGNLPEAIKSLQADLAITESLAKADPKNAGCRGIWKWATVGLAMC